MNKKDIIKEIWDGVLPYYYLSDKYIPILYNKIFCETTCQDVKALFSEL